jgi:putative ABC transport system permease protein
MIENYLKIAWRNIRRSPGYSLINIFGLATGLACFILILLFVQHEFSYDGFHKKADQIYRVVQKRPTPDGANYWAVTSPAMAGTLTREFPEVAATTSVMETFNPLLSLGDQHFREQGILADTAFLNIFTFPLLEGNPKTALKDPGSIVLTRTLARKIFGDTNPIGSTLLYRGQHPHVVTGIMSDVPETSHLKFSYILPIQSDPYYRDCMTREAWFNNGLYTYAVLAEAATAQQVEGKMSAYIDRNLADRRKEDRMTFSFQPLKDIHLKSSHLITFNFERSGSLKYVWLFLSIGFLVLLLACINYMNLAVARSMKRTREIGLRKVIGAWRHQLVGQFLGESMIMTLLATVLAHGFVHLLLPFFSHMVERPIRMDYFSNPLLLPGLLSLTILVALLSGSYPAFLITSLRPVLALTGRQGIRAGRFAIQRVLIVGQYAVSIALIAGSLVISRQMQFVQGRELGYNREHILTIEVNDPALSQRYALIREELLQDPHILGMSYSSFLPTSVERNQNMFDWEGSDGKLLPSHTSGVDYDFLDVYGIGLAAGRGFSREFGTDTLGAPLALINETAAKGLGWTPEEAVGKDFGYSDGRGRRTIIGVVKDFHYNSIHNALGPLVLTLDRESTGYLSARIRPENLSRTIALFKAAVEEATPYPFEYQFLDNSFGQLYKTDVKLGEMVRFFTILSFLIASLGLFGLAAYAAGQRIKEISVRKVLGASVSSVMTLLSKDFIRLVLISVIIATPLSWYALNRWLQDFVYRIEISWWMFAATGLLAVVIAVLTVSLQSVKAALTNPAENLHRE